MAVKTSLTSALATRFSAAVSVAAPPFSEIDDEDRISDAAGAPSSSRMARVRAGGSAAPRPPAAAPETVTRLSGESTLSSAAVTVTVPALAVAPAATVSVRAALRAKSPSAAFAPAAADTVTVTASADGCDSVAVTVATPPFSAIDAGVSASESAGVASSSAIVSAASVTAPAPQLFAAAPETATRLSGESASLPWAAIVTVPELPVRPAGTTRIPPVCVKSAADAPAPAAADTVIVVGALDGCESVAVTVATPPDSEIDAGETASAAIGAPSSSAIVSVAEGGARTSSLAAARTVTRLSGASTALSTPAIVTAPALSVVPAAKVSVAAAESVKSSAAAPDAEIAAADTVSVDADTAALSSVAVTVETPASEIDAGVSVSVAFGSGVMGTHFAKR